VRRHLLEILAIVLIVGSLAFFGECIVFLTRRDYVAAIILMFIGFAVIRVGTELARASLVQKE
jgi:hypothetical protein